MGDISNFVRKGTAQELRDRQKPVLDYIIGRRDTELYALFIEKTGYQPSSQVELELLEEYRVEQLAKDIIAGRFPLPSIDRSQRFRDNEVTKVLGISMDQVITYKERAYGTNHSNEFTFSIDDLHDIAENLNIPHLKVEQGLKKFNSK